MDYALKRIAVGSFEQVTEAVEHSIEVHGFIVVGTYDMHVTLARKGFHIHPVRIYEIRDKKSRRAVDMADGRMGSLAFLPGSISVFMEDGEVVVAVVRSGIVVQKMFPGASLDEEAVQLEGRVVQIVEDAVEGIRRKIT